MATVIESSVWVDFFRPKTPLAVKEQIRPWILRSDLALCEPIICEILRSGPATERAIIERYFSTVLVLPTPATLWREATRLGQACHDAGVHVGALDLLIATVCLHHAAVLVTFDQAFNGIAKVSRMRVNVLQRAR